MKRMNAQVVSNPEHTILGAVYALAEATNRLTERVDRLEAALLAAPKGPKVAPKGPKVTISKASPKGKKAPPKVEVETMIEDMTPEEWAIRAKAYKAAKKLGGTYREWNEAGAAAVWAARNA